MARRCCSFGSSPLQAADHVLNAEEAAARLEAVANASWRQHATSRVERLSPKLHPTAEALLAQAEPLAWRQHELRLTAAAVVLDELSDRDRVDLLSAVHPGLGEAFAGWWVDAQAGPYQRNWGRRAFRAPTAPQLTREWRIRDLVALLDALGPHPDADPQWFAAWGGHASHGRGVTVGKVLASVIDRQSSLSDSIVQTLITVANGEHPVGLMGQHVIVALLNANRSDGWDYIRRMLLAAQLQEGLRQSILETVDEANPAAFDLMINTVLDHNLLRFAAAVRAASVWVGVAGDVSEIPKVEHRVRTLLALRTDEAARLNALRSDHPADVYLALCIGATRDVLRTMPEAEEVATHPSPDVRAVAARFASMSGLLSGQQLLIGMLSDADLPLAALALAGISDKGLQLPEAFPAVSDLVRRLPAKPRVLDVTHSGLAIRLDRQATAARLIPALGDRPVDELIPWLEEMDASGRSQVARRLGREPEMTAGIRTTLLDLVGDRSSMVRKNAIDALATTKLAPDEAAGVEALLTRSASDVRRASLTLLASQPRASALASVDRLAASSDKRQQEAATELARALGATGDALEPGAVSPHLAAFPAPVEDLRATLVNPGGRTPPRTPRKVLTVEVVDDASRRAVEALDGLVQTQKDVPVLVTSWQGTQEILFGDVRHFPSPYAVQQASPDDTQEGRGLLLGELFRSWWSQRPADMRGEQDLDALHAYFLTWVTQPMHVNAVRAGSWWFTNVQSIVGRPDIGLRHHGAVAHVLDWLTADDASAASIECCLDAFETSLALLPESMRAQELTSPPNYGNHLHRDDWRNLVERGPWSGRLAGLLRTRTDLFAPEHLARWYGLMRWVERPNPGAQALAIDTRLLTAAHAAGVATDDDVLAAFLDPRDRLFRDLTRHWRHQLVQRQPALVALADRVRDRVVAVELQRGDLPTPTSAVALNVGSISGAETAMGLLRLLGKTPLERSRLWSADSKGDVLSYLLRMSFPDATDTADVLLAAARAENVSDQRLVDLAMYAPQWAQLVESAVGWPGLASGVLWLHAHTKDDRWSVDRELRESWAAMVAERTPLAADDLIAGAVDVDWFGECYEQLGAQRWRVLHKSAKNASGGNGHRRAQVFAEALIGQVEESTLVERIEAKRNQDAVRALGILPLPAEPDERAAAVSRRYDLLCEFERGSRQFGALRQNSERTAVRIGVDNLARTAGYSDPQRFIWAVEAAEAGDLAQGPVSVTVDDVTVTLSVSDEGMPDLRVRRGERVLQSVPAGLRKDPAVAELRARKTALTRQARRVRAGLEAAMVSRDSFTDEDLSALDRHPIVAPMLDGLLWVDEEGRIGSRAAGGLVDPTGSVVSASTPIRLAHPVDLVGQDWIAWQEQVFARGRRQPFKQVFRELYVLTDAERAASPLSRRYEGHQLQPRQALALFTGRGWVTSRESGDTSRVFHRYGIAARVEFMDGFLTPLEADLPTIGAVYFTRRGEYLAQPLEDVPPIVFSETMRDLDLVVSVAHAGGVDPEASASTTEMRAALIRETARLLKLTNLSFAGTHVVIEGSLGEYSVHLGSGTVASSPRRGCVHRARRFTAPWPTVPALRR